MKCDSTLYSGGLYGCLKEELEEVLNDIDNNVDLFVVSVKMVSGMTIYSLPGTLTKCKEILNDIVDATKNGEMMMLVGVTWINLSNVLTTRICKYIPKEETLYYD